MKNQFAKIVTLFILFCSATTIAQSTKGYTIRITIKGLKEGSNCVLAYYYGGINPIQDSAKSNANGEIVFKGPEKNLQGVYLIQTPNKKYFDFIMDAEQNFSLETDTADYFKNLKIKGSSENKLFYDYQVFMGAEQKKAQPYVDLLKKVKNNKDSTKIVEDKIAAIDKEVKDYKLDFIKNNPKTFVTQLFKAMQDPEIPTTPAPLPNGQKDTAFAYHYYKTHFFDNFNFNDERLLRTPIFHSKIKQYLDKLTPQRPDSINVAVDYLIEKARGNQEVFKYLINWITYTYESSKNMGMDAVFVHMVERYYITNQTPWVDSTHKYNVINKGMRLKPLLIGTKAPALNMQDTTGKYVSLYDVKAKYTIVVFWEPSCGHCQKEIPKLINLYKKIKDKGVQVYAIETDDPPAEWKKFIIDHQLNWINVNEPDPNKRNTIKKTYDIYMTPIIYLLDENKVIKAKQIDSEQLGNLIEMIEKGKRERDEVVYII